MTRTTLLAAVAALALGACGNNAAETTDATTTDATTEAMATDPAANMPSETATTMDTMAPPAMTPAEAPAGAATAATYAPQAAISDMYEIESSQLALEETQAPAVREFAQRMIDEHRNSTNQLKTALSEGNVDVTLPTEMDARRQQLVEQLRAAPEGQFDQLYTQQQLQAHREAVALHNAYAQGGDNPQLQAFAKQVVPIVEGHLETLQGMNTGGTAATPPATPDQ